MIPEDRLKPILEELLARSRQDKVRWAPQRTLNPETLAGEWGYFVDIGGIRLSVSRNSSQAAPEYISVRLGDSKARELHSDLVFIGDDRFAFYEDLFTEADRHVTGWDKALGSIMETLDSEEVVGAGTVKGRPQSALTAG